MTEAEPAEQIWQGDALRALLDYAIDAITVITREGRVVLDSATAERMTGHRTGARVGQSIFDRVHVDDFTRTAAAIARAMIAPDPVGPFQFRYQHANGTWRTLEAVARALEVDRGDRVCVLSARDVTGRVLVEEEVRRAQKMEALERLAGSIAHDFNNVLTTILGNADFALASELADGVRPQLMEIRDAADVATSLVRQLQLFSEKRLTRTDIVDASELVEQMAAVLRRMVGPEIQLSVTSIVAGPAHVQLGHGNLEQVVMNLVLNARDAMPAGGRLDVTVGCSMMEAAEGGTRDFVTVRVADSGVGMAPQVRARIFEPYFTTKAVGKGSGLGLATVYGIVTDAGGSIDVITEPGQGTTFAVHFPRALPKA